MADQTHSSHDNRIERTLAFINSNLDRPLNIDQLAAVAAMSRHHFQRSFKASEGTSVARYVQKKRLKRACFQLAFHQYKPVTEIAFDAQYGSPEAFSKAFAKSFGVSPRQFRLSPNFSFWSEHESNCHQKEQAMNIDIVNFEAINLAVLEHRGPLNRVHITLQQFVAWRKELGPSPKTSRTFNIYYDDPELIAAQNYRMDVGAELFSTLKPNDFGVVKKTIPDLLCAKLRQFGSWNGLGTSMRHLCADWLPASQYEADAFPIFVQRINLYPDVPESDLITDIYLPITNKKGA